MINLIPPSAKKQIIHEYWLRVISIWFFILTGIFCILASLLLPVYVLINSQVAVYAPDAEVAINEAKSYDLSSTQLVLASKEAKLLLQLKEKTRFSELTETLFKLQNPGITINYLKFQETPTGLAPIDISGAATTRQSLANFRENLLQNPIIDTVDLPISNLALDKDIDFNISVKLKTP